MSRAADRHHTATPAPASASASAEVVGARLVWVVDPPECPGRWPGVAMEARREGRHLLVRLAFAVAELPGRPGAVLVERWLSATQVTAVDVAPFGPGGVEPAVRGRAPRTDADLAANPEVMRLLHPVAAGRVSHGEDNRGGLAVPWLLDGESVGLQLKALARAELVELPFGGPVRLAARGRQLLALTGDGV